MGPVHLHWQAMLVLLVLRPVMRDLAEKGAVVSQAALPEPEGEGEHPALENETGEQVEAGKVDADADVNAEDVVPELLLKEDAPLIATDAEDYGRQIKQARLAVADDPRLAARVVKDWVGNDA